ncbi:MAG: response regulator transcription factor [Erythrobacter sp.]|uniref:response regulator transcription factor n=1 Tax=Erythrobacter sp. TaxID=1042 RepID=UPI003298A948
MLLADDHPAFRKGVSQFFEQRADFQQPTETGDGSACLKHILQHEPDWAIIDLSMPEKTGFEVLEALLASNVTTRVIVMSMHADDIFADRARDLGASGFIAKEDALSELGQALAAPSNSFYTSQSVGKVVPNFLVESRNQSADKLTVKETEVLRLIGLGQTNRDIAAALNISVRTVHSHRRNMADKLDLRGPNRLMQFAVSRLGRQ